MEKIKQDPEGHLYSAAVVLGLYAAARMDGSWNPRTATEHVLVEIRITPEMKRFIEKTLCKRPEVNQAEVETELFSALASAGLDHTIEEMMKDKELIKHIMETS